MKEQNQTETVKYKSIPPGFSEGRGLLSKDLKKIYWKKSIIDFYFVKKTSSLIFKNRRLLTIYLPFAFGGFFSIQIVPIIENTGWFSSDRSILITSCLIAVSCMLILVYGAGAAFNLWLKKVQESKGFPLCVSFHKFSPELFKEKNEYFYQECIRRRILSTNHSEFINEFAEIMNEQEELFYFQNWKPSW